MNYSLSKFIKVKLVLIINIICEQPLETWLRLAKIPYQNVYTRKFAKSSHTIPYIELNGVQIADSNTIMATLRKQYSVTVDGNLTLEQVALSHAFTSMIENHTAQVNCHRKLLDIIIKLFLQIGFWWRYGLKMDDFAREALSTWKNTFGMRWFMPMGLRLKGRLCVFGRLGPDEAMELSFRDLDALSVMLADKPYLLGDMATSLDCTVFGHLSQFLFIDINFPQEKYLRENCPNLVSLVERIKLDVWPDWEEMCNDS